MGSDPNATAKRPNFLFILADDLVNYFIAIEAKSKLTTPIEKGFSDVGCYGSEINTPNIDRLASEGIRMLNHHAAAACSPTRAMLMSGTDAHLGGLGCMIEHRRSKKGSERWGGKAGYEGYLNQDVATLPELLSDNGYFTAMSGKVLVSPLVPYSCHVSFMFGWKLTESVAPWTPGKSRTVGARIPASFCYASWLL